MTNASLKRRIQVHFTRTSSSWLAWWGWFLDLIDKQICRRAFGNESQLIASIKSHSKHSKHHDETNTGFHWTAKIGETLAKGSPRKFGQKTRLQCFDTPGDTNDRE